MEISRWGIEKFIHLSDRYREFTQFLTVALEGDQLQFVNSGKSIGSDFQVFDAVKFQHHFSKISDNPKKVNLRRVFEALSPFFLAGFCLQTSAGRMEQFETLDSMFLFGKIFHSEKDESYHPELFLPNFSDGRVFRGRSAAVLRAFHLDGIERLKDSIAIAFSPHAHSVFILICNRPGPWQVDLIEKVVIEVVDLLKSSGKEQKA